MCIWIPSRLITRHFKLPPAEGVLFPLERVILSAYVLNGGLSGYFGRRLGMLGHCMTALTLVTADGSIKELKASAKADQKLFQAILGAGPALGVVTSLTFQMENSACIRTGGQLVVPCEDLEAAQAFTRRAVGFRREIVLDDLRVSMELVVTADFTAISTLVFYDSNREDPSLYVEPLREAARELDLPLVMDDVQQWTSWFEVASCLWPIIAEMHGNPMVRLDHCVGTRTAPTDAQLDFVVQDWLTGIPHKEAPMSIMECRTLGGAMLEDHQDMVIPSGNSKCVFFCDMVVAFDNQHKSKKECKDNAQQVDAAVALARSQPGLQANFSATHSQWNDFAVKREEVFGSAAACHLVKSVKGDIDASNRFCFHSLV
ncbi:MAG: hypothetical protein SGILL_000486 [Bacillariaceae sp.]